MIQKKYVTEYDKKKCVTESDAKKCVVGKRVKQVCLRVRERNKSVLVSGR